MGWGIITFRRQHTAVYPNQRARLLVENGPYRHTRNPMYLGMTFLYLGVTALLNSWWALLLLPVVLWALVRLVISREERYLAAEFGEHYGAYRRRVRRWI
jgi:protein-S-isoprenylcysteine O-methyltransferase Ste14